MDYYRGFWIRQETDTRWRGERHGVTCSGSTKKQLEAVIDRHVADRREWLDKQKGA